MCAPVPRLDTNNIIMSLTSLHELCSGLSSICVIISLLLKRYMYMYMHNTCTCTYVYMYAIPGLRQ